MNNSNIRQKGYTLAELIVSLGLFTIVVFIGIGSLLVITAETREARATQRLVNNTSFVLDDIVTSARVGSGHWCGDSDNAQSREGDCNVGEGSYFGFLSIDGKKIVYRLNDDAVIEKSTDDGENYEPITGNNIVVDFFDVYVSGSDVDDGLQGHARVVIKSTINKGTEEEDSISLQSFITKRATDF